MLKLLGIKRLTPSQEEVFKKLFKNKIDIYTPSITFLTFKQKRDFKKRCVEEKIYSSYEIKVDYKYKNDINKVAFLIYLTKEKAKENINAIKNGKKYIIKFSGLHFKKVCRQTLNDNIILTNLIVKALENEWEDNPGMYFPPNADYWTSKQSKEVELYKQPSKKTITIGYKNKKDISDFVKNLNIKKKIGNYYPTLIYLEIKELKRYLDRVKKNIKVEEKFGQEKLIKNKKGFLLQKVTTFSLNNKQKRFIFYLTKSQIKDLILFRKGGFGIGGKIYISFSNNQLVKTYKEVIKINSFLYYYKNIRKHKPYNKQTNKQQQTKQKLLAISDKPYNNQELLSLTENLEKDLVDFSDEEKDLIDFGDEVKDLIDLNVIIPNPKPTAKELLMDEELFPKGKKYKVLNEDLIQTNTKPSTNGENILKNILNYPETKRLLGISLTTDLKDKIKNLDSEASFGLASIISSLLTANRGKMSIYSISRNQLKEIIEGFITTLSVLLYPTEKY